MMFAFSIDSTMLSFAHNFIYLMNQTINYVEKYAQCLLFVDTQRLFFSLQKQKHKKNWIENYTENTLCWLLFYINIVYVYPAIVISFTRCWWTIQDTNFRSFICFHPIFLWDPPSLTFPKSVIVSNYLYLHDLTLLNFCLPLN